MIPSYILTIRRCVTLKTPICFSLPILHVIGSSFGSKCITLILFEKVSCFAKLLSIVYFLIKIYYHNYFTSKAILRTFPYYSFSGNLRQTVLPFTPIQHLSIKLSIPSYFITQSLSSETCS
nr:MAG TPA: hypothetical protein [Bacteriophage sp.]